MIVLILIDMTKKENLFKTNADIFKAFSDEKRQRILALLREGELCACQLIDTLGIGQPNLSHHMKVLCDSGIVSRRKEGRWMHYSINPRGREKILRLLMDITASTEEPALANERTDVSSPRLSCK